MESNNEIKVSICCLVYNHEKYLRQCLDGFMMQKTNFKFEVLIHDDASTDGSTDIIREYEVKYPDIIKPIYQSENQYSKGVKISWVYQYPRVQGKYIALCEGDDFWTDQNKLQMQFEALEEHKNCHFCACTVRSVSEDGTPRDDTLPEQSFGFDDDCEIDSNEWMRILYSNKKYVFQTSSYFFDAAYIRKIMYDIPDFFRLSPVGDAPLMNYFSFIGDAYYICKEMSCYRKGSLGSWTTTHLGNPLKIVNHNKRHIQSYMEFDKFTHYKYHEMIESEILRQEFSSAVLLKDYKKVVSRKYRRMYNELSRKEKIYFSINAYFPLVMKVYNRGKAKYNE